MSMVLKPEPAGRTTVTANHPSFWFFKLPKSKIFKFSVNLSNCGQTTWFSKLNTSLTVPKKSQNIAQNNLQHQIFPKKEKKKTSKKKKNRRLWKKGYKSASGLCIWSASTSASSLFIEKLWNETVVCLKTVEEIIEGERGGGCRGNRKAKRIEGKSHRIWSLIMWCGVRKCVNFDHDAWGNVWVGLGFSWDLMSHIFFSSLFIQHMLQPTY